MSFFWAVACLLVLCAAAAAGDKVNSIRNGDFETGLSGWDVQGDVARETAAPLAGTGSVRLGPGQASISQRYAITGERVVGFEAVLKAVPSAVLGTVRARCYDAGGHLVQDVHVDTDPKTTGADHRGLYFKTQAHTVSMILSIEKNGNEPGTVYADTVEFNDYDHDRQAHAPLCDLHQYMKPFWHGGTMYSETVLLESVGGKPASGKLLFRPTEILSVMDYGHAHTYAAGKDYTLNGRTITCTSGSAMPFMKDTDFPPDNSLQWYVLDGKHILVTYTHNESWAGPRPRYAGASFPRVTEKLCKRLPLTIVADGDSITLGDNTSGYMQIPPYMPTWAELFVRQLKRNTGNDKITLYNTALGGMNSYWGLDNAESDVASLHPDLVLLAFGMNDFWSLTPDEFQQNIQGMIDRVRKRCPQAEFLLISSMPFDPVYTADPMYTGHMAGYVTALRSFTGSGVGLLDMNAIGTTLFAAKKPIDMVANPLHPNDFLARWYAQGLVAMLTPPQQNLYQ